MSVGFKVSTNTPSSNNLHIEVIGPEQQSLFSDVSTTAGTGGRTGKVLRNTWNLAPF